MANDPDSADGSNLSRDELYEKYQLDRRWDYPDNVSKEVAYYEDSKYPPDWGEDRTDVADSIGGRREAVLEFQDDRCARCGTHRDDAETFEVHHYRELSEGGQNSLQNLIGLCGPCHALSHPDVEVMNADWRDAELLPSRDADPRVATVRTPLTAAERERYLPELAFVSEISEPVENERATSDATIPVSPADALAASKDLDALLENIGIGSTVRHTVRVVNEARNPIDTATVRVELPDPADDLGAQTNGDGEACFDLPSGRTVSVHVTADGFNEVTVERSVASENDAGPVVLEYTGDAVPVDSGGTSRRSYLSYGVVAAVGAAGGALLLGDDSGESTSASAGDGSAGGGSPDATASPTPQPPAGFAAGWTYSLDVPEPISDTAVTDSGILYQTQSGLVAKLDQDGNELWSIDLASTLVEGLTVAGGTVAVNCEEKVVTLDASSGTKRLELPREADDDPRPSVVLGDDVVVLGYDTDYSDYDESYRVTAYRLGSGESLWELESSSEYMAMVNGTLFLNGSSYVESPETEGEKSAQSITSAGRRDTELEVSGSVSYHAFNGDDEVRVYAMDLARRAVTWETSIGDRYVEAEGLEATDRTVLLDVGDAVIGVDSAGEEKYRTGLPNRNDSTAVRSMDGTAFSVSGGELYGVAIDRGVVTHRRGLDGDHTDIQVLDTQLVVATESGTVESYRPE